MRVSLPRSAALLLLAAPLRHRRRAPRPRPPQPPMLLHGVDVSSSRFFSRPTVQQAVEFAAHAHRCVGGGQGSRRSLRGYGPICVRRGLRSRASGPPQTGLLCFARLCNAGKGAAYRSASAHAHPVGAAEGCRPARRLPAPFCSASRPQHLAPRLQLQCYLRFSKLRACGFFL